MRAGAGPAAYSAAKAGVISITRSAALELAADRIRVNCVCPGGINTPLLGQGASSEAVGQVLDHIQPWPEHGRPEDVAAAMCFLASDEARFVTGEALVVDGGLTIASGPRAAGGVRPGAAMASFGGAGAPAGSTGVSKGSTGEPPVIRPPKQE